MPCPPILVSLFPLATLLLSVAACDSATNHRSRPALVEASLEPTLSNNAAPSICGDHVAAVLELSKSYSGDVKNFREGCPDGVQCEAIGEANVASFNNLTNGHAGLLFACAPASAEVCDGLDNNKDGNIDEDFPNEGFQCTAGLGVCLRGGVNVCGADGTGTVCTAVPGSPTGTDFCDGFDNDCDGVTDQDFPDKGSFCTAGVGACLRGGVRICSADGLGTECSAAPGTPSAEEFCDSLDNDCDNKIDEDFPDKGSLCTTGVGACLRGGQRMCSADGNGTECSAQAGEPVTEMCDGIDNDCDGVTDEGCGTP